MKANMFRNVGAAIAARALCAFMVLAPAAAEAQALCQPRTDTLRRSLRAAILAVLLFAGTIPFAPAASADGGLECKDPVIVFDHAFTHCSGHGYAYLRGDCGVMRNGVHDYKFLNHSSESLYIQCYDYAPITNVWAFEVGGQL